MDKYFLTGDIGNCFQILIALLSSFAVFSFVSCTTTPPVSRPALDSVNKWFALFDYDPYKAKLTQEQLAEYDLVMLDADSHPPFSRTAERPIVIAYVSLGEAEVYRFYWKKIKDEEWVIEENPHWEGNYYIDPRSKVWRNLIVKEVVGRVHEAGFDGIFMDTLDTAELLEEGRPGEFRGAYQAMIQLVKEIRAAYPGLIMISNNGFEILPEIAPFIDAALAEDIHMMVDFENNSYTAVSEEDRNYKVSLLKNAMRRHGLAVFNIDYVDMQNKGLIEHCLRQSKALGFKPYVAEKNLDKIYETV